MRKPSACGVCRARRRRCIWPAGSISSTPCEYCALYGLQCVQKPPDGGWYHRRQLRLQVSGTADAQLPGRTSQPRDETPLLRSPSEGAASALETPQAAVVDHNVIVDVNSVPMALRLDLVGCYFDYIHDQFHSLFHRPTFEEDVAKNRIPAILLLAVFALSARFSNHDHFADVAPRDRGERFRVACEAQLRVRHVSILTVQVCVLLGAYSAGHGEIEAENVYYTLAGRMACTMNLLDRPVSSLLEREMNIRAWWSLCMIDVWSSTAVKLPRIMPPAAHIPAAVHPMDELPFLEMGTNDPMSASGGSALLESPLLAEMIKLNRVLANIIDFNKTCVAARLAGPALDSGVQKLSLELEHWLVSLPPSMSDTPENLAWFAARGLGRMFAAVYLGYYYFSQLLYFQFLGGTVDDGNSSKGRLSVHVVYAERCKTHAARLCDLIYRCADTPGADVRYPMVAHVLVIASTVQIHTLLFAASEQPIREARARLERNFQIILLDLKPFWPAVDGAMSRLRAFHQTCLGRSGDGVGGSSPGSSSAFVLDQWLLRFLVEFSDHMEDEPREMDPNYEALWSLSKAVRKDGPGAVLCQVAEASGMPRQEERTKPDKI
ncbi:hypothetical protein MAPG_09301 [Magnaporthiopsis poae ATCC 64411]|uniref:Zn(2)-C6 fungal-type domain-containing protein n=1 Tax=Magnaporthiopsis poae (strain ATCC 64411 / 73-15) TaxID=644358 RepID=A0A0C4E9K8_MAGP6|nr:hypothetical protein MAPG_09301 [Magnaporthiopsis poae ATCC 64411]